MHFIVRISIFSLLIILLAVCTSPLLSAQDDQPPEAPQQPPIITDAEYKVLDYALSQMLMTRKDLGFKKDYVDDDYRTQIVQRHLDDPMLVPVECDAISRDILNHAMQPTYILKKAAGLIDREPEIPVNMQFHRPWEAIAFDDASGIIGFSRWDNITLSADFMDENAMSLLNDAISQFVTGLGTAADRVEPAFMGLNDEEIDFLLEYAPKLLHEDIEEDEEIGAEPYAKTKRLLHDTKLVNWKALYGAAMIASAATEQFAGRVYTIWTEQKLQSEPEGILYDGISSVGRVVIGGFGHNIYDNSYVDCAVIIDLGGDDIYEIPAGRGSLFDGRPVGVALDMGGNDLYISRTDYSQGSGFFGIGILSDWTGDDTYYGGNFSQGAGFFGVGILHDWGGWDNYSGDTLAQGAGAFGIGILCDGGGNDHYRAAYLSQAFGFTLGCGILADSDGHDYYHAGGKYEDYPRWKGQNLSLSQGFGYGIRPVASGGAGVLVDGGGNDFYSAEVYGQGCSYWFSLGILADFDGNDKYSATQYAQGSGIHLSVGCLIDYRGNDYYTSWACGQGGAHDFAVGWLIDHEGDDFYTCRDLGLGSGNANAVGILIDRAGEDGYFAKAPERAIASALPARDYGGIAILIDMSGPDTYSDPSAGNGKVWTRSSWGVGCDVDMEMRFWRGLVGGKGQ